MRRRGYSTYSMALYVSQVLFWVAFALLLHIYIGYPLLLRIQSSFRVKNRAPLLVNEDNLPSLTLFISVFNESSVIKAKLDNALSLDYPSGLLEVAVASDGSTDATNEIIEGYRERGVKVFINQRNEGKNSVINQYAPRTSGDVIVFTDANAMFSDDALRHMAAHFSDKRVGCVGGKLQYLKGSGPIAQGEGFYFRYENYIRKLEGSLGVMVGANGAIYAIRRSLFIDVPLHTPNDFFHPLTVLQRGYEARFEEKAIAYEKPTIDRKEEFRRRSRIVMRSVGAVMEIRRRFGSLLGKGWFNLFSHKILRWFTVPIYLVLLFANISMIETPFYFSVMILQLLLIMVGGCGFLCDLAGVKLKILTAPYYFVLINFAAITGIYKYFRGERVKTWKQAQTTR